MTSEMKVIRPTGWQVNVPAGKYFLGDPCYAVPDEDWIPLLDSCGVFQTSPVGTVHGHQVLALSTAWGDGTYQDQYGIPYSVDSGLIGLVPEALYLGHERHELNALGRFVEFYYEVACRTDARVLTFGHIMIDTNT